MNSDRPKLAAVRLAFRLGYGLLKFLPNQASKSFGPSESSGKTIGKIYVINLDRAPDRWSRIKGELKRLRNECGQDLLDLTERYAAVDAESFLDDPPIDTDVNPFFTLADQLFVEPQPLTLPTRFELEASIRMSRAEIAVARSHIDIWRRIARGTEAYALILEDDVWFDPTFGSYIDRAWKEITNRSADNKIDVFYVSYVEATRGAPKELVSQHVFVPERGLWHLSGYILSREGARKLLANLPCRGPVDLWINHQFSKLKVFATRRAIVRQRRDTFSSNSYSILPALSTIGAINSEGAALFHGRPPHSPVFAFGPTNSGQSSLAMALSMLGYRCCSDLEELPLYEMKRLDAGRTDRIFNAYVNVGRTEAMIEELRRSYPQAKYIVTASPGVPAPEAVQNLMGRLQGADAIILNTRDIHAWRILCEHLRCVPPLCPFPTLEDLGQRPVSEAFRAPNQLLKRERRKWDRSPWIVGREHQAWSGIRISNQPPEDENLRYFGDGPKLLDLAHWATRSDTFTDNLALFRSSNIEPDGLDGAKIHVRPEDLGVRQYSAGALTSRAEYLYGRFEVTLRASDVPGVITGFFLHRNSPHQEIDIEILGREPRRLLVNVFYNPGREGDKFDYGYRGCPNSIDLGFDASKGLHRYAIEWTPCEIRWYVDDRLVHRRDLWDPTPIPHLPMKLHLNAWPSRASRFAGRLSNRRLPAIAEVRTVRASANASSLCKPVAQSYSGTDEPAGSGAPG